MYVQKTGQVLYNINPPYKKNMKTEKKMFKCLNYFKTKHFDIYRIGTGRSIEPDIASCMDGYFACLHSPNLQVHTNKAQYDEH